MEQTERQWHERALRLAEVRLWAVERDLELFTGREPTGAREDLEGEAESLREAIESERAWLEERLEREDPQEIPPHRPTIRLKPGTT